MSQETIPVITIDGPSASGKGTIATLLAQKLGWHTLDSGALYRLTALKALQTHHPLTDEEGLAKLASQLQVQFTPQGIFLDQQNVDDVLRSEKVGEVASKVAPYLPVRQALLQLQYSFRQAPGLVADGRDMGTVIFPDAPLKIFLVADVVKRAERRYKQLIDKGFSVTLESLVFELSERDRRDTQRQYGPLCAAPDAIELDSTSLTIQETLDRVYALWQERVKR